MTSNYEDPDVAYLDEAARKERVDALLAARPPRYSVPGTLHPDIAAWADLVADGGAANLIVAGRVGTGKSWSVWEAALRLARNPAWPAWRPAHTVTVLDAADFREAASPHAHPDDFGRLCRTAVLIIDDAGSVRLSDWDGDRLFAVVEKRHAWMRPTGITTNAKDLPAALGPRIASRLQHGAVIVTLDGEDRRRA